MAASRKTPARPKRVSRRRTAKTKLAAPATGPWRCGVCGALHDELPMGFGAPEPELAGDVPEDEKDTRVVNDGESCVVDDAHFFLKGSLEIPVWGVAHPFVWTVWVSLSEPDFVRALDLWRERGREKEPPYGGSLATRIPIYPDTLGLETRVHTREVGKRPLVELVASDHPLVREQRDGITMARVREIAQALLHPTIV